MMRKMLRRSVRARMTCILIVIVTFTIACTWFLNATFAKSFYRNSQKKLLIRTYNQIKDVMDADDLSKSERLTKLKVICNNNTSQRLMIADYTTSSPVYYINMMESFEDDNQTMQYLKNLYLYTLIQEKRKSSEEYSGISWVNESALMDFSGIDSNGYVLKTLENPVDKTRLDQVLFGVTSEGHLVAIRASIDDLETSVQISSTFLLYMGLLGIVIGSVFIWIYIKHFTKPITEMAGVAEHMTNLEFDAKVEVQTEDELGDLAKAMNKMSDTLEETIADLKTVNLELQEDIEKKEEIDEMRKEFLSHVSHELKTPIALVQGYAEGLRDNVIEDDESKEFYCDVIIDEAQKMNQLVKSLLTLNQIEFGNKVKIERFDLAQMILYKIRANKILFEKKKVDIQFVQKDELWYVWGDEFMIEEVVSNYLSNALNHVFDEGTIRVWFDRHGKDVRTHVFNEGKQIPEEDIEKLWTKFYKVDKARTREYGGNGIGLSIVEATMKAHGKEYGVLNHENGVEFYFDLEGAE